MWYAILFLAGVILGFLGAMWLGELSDQLNREDGTL